MLVEIQALVAPTSYGTPRRAVVGWDGNRLAMVIAVLEARCGLQIGARDIYLNVAGGLRIGEPAADLAVAAALVSALTLEPMPADTVVFGEIGLSGEVRPVGQTEARLKEAAKLGFSTALTPARRSSRQKRRGQGARRRQRHRAARARASAPARRDVRGCRAAPGARPGAGRVMTVFDFAVIGVIILSGYFAYSRGFVREALSIAAWINASFVALYTFPYVLPLFEKVLPKGVIANVSAAAVVFILALMVLHMISNALARRVKDSSLSPVDRTFGMIFGLARGMIFVCLGYIALAWMLPTGKDRPRWFADARSIPYLDAGAGKLRSFIPLPRSNAAAHRVRLAQCGRKRGRARDQRLPQSLQRQSGAAGQRRTGLHARRAARPQSPHPAAECEVRRPVRVSG